MFDGSSIAGWKGINESDMILMPDADTAVMDPFFEEPTLNLRCDIIEPATMQGYERDPRSLAKRAEAYLKSTGIADGALFGPENEFFIFDDVRWGADISGSLLQDRLRRSLVEFREGVREWQPGPPARRSRAATSRCRRWTRCRTSAPPCAWRWKRWAWCIEDPSPRSGNRRPERDRHRVQHPGTRRPTRCRSSSTWCRTSPHPTARQPPSCPSRSWATTAPACTCTSRLQKDGNNLFSRQQVRRAVRDRAVTTSAASSSTPVR